jgi:mannose-6-phosphate isomerase-like protein (cupin superfamily)
LVPRGRQVVVKITIHTLEAVTPKKAVAKMPSPFPAESAHLPYEVVDFQQLPSVACPCGEARRAFHSADDFPATIHLTHINRAAQAHYHKRTTEVYYILECSADAALELNQTLLPVSTGMAILIRPGTVHRARGEMKILLVASPKFDPADEFLVSPEAVKDS